MNIVHVNETYWPVVGGLERAIQSIAEELTKLGHEVHVITSRFGAINRSNEEIINGVHIHRIKALRLHYQDLMIPIESFKVIDVLRKADVVICWSQNSYFNYKICDKAKKLRKLVAVYFLGVDYLKNHYNPLIKIFGYPYQRWITQKMANLADISFVTNDYERKLLKEKYFINSITLPHGIDEAYYKLSNAATSFRMKYNVEGKVIAFIGRIHPTKGVDLLIKAFAEVIKKEPSAILVIAGSGDRRYLKKCLKLAEKIGLKERVKYFGYLSEEDKIGLIDASDVVVLPSKHAGESYPLLVNEVLARGRRLIITKGNIASKWIEESGIAKVVNADPQELSQAIIDELKHRTDKATGIRRTIEIPTWRDVAHKLLEFLQQT
jgi:glycosyltransferase involved in cell wall biosynthesis